MVPGQHVPHLVWEREHPLAHGDVGEDVIDQVRGALGHPPPSVARTRPPGFARKRDQPVGAAGAAPKAGELPGEPAAAQKLAEFLFDETRHSLAVARTGGLGEERFEVIENDLVEDAVLRRVRFVRGGQRGHPVHDRMSRAGLPGAHMPGASPWCGTFLRQATPPKMAKSAHAQRILPRDQLLSRPNLRRPPP